MFSELVDEAVTRSVHPERKADIIAWTNLTIQEMQGKGNFFSKNLIEEQLSVTISPFIWTRPDRIQKLRTILYSSGVFPKFIMPGRKQFNEVDYYYAASTYYVFSGILVGEQINAAYYQFRKRLSYYSVGARPASYNFETETWTYYDLTASGGLDYTLAANQVTARDLVSNWILKDWYSLVLEGDLAKIYKGVNDETRAATHFSFFERTYQSLFLGSETYETLDK